MPFFLHGEAKPNILLICIDDLRPELRCYGKEYIHSPHIDQLAKEGTLFKQHYVQAPTCGASRYTLLTGQYGPNQNHALFLRSQQMTKGQKNISPSLPAAFREKGYETVSLGKISHHPGGRGGRDWNDDTIKEMPNAWDVHLNPSGNWLHPRGTMHGLAHGEIRKRAKDMAVYQAKPGKDQIYPDGLMIDEAQKQLERLAQNSNKPFFLAVGIVRPHLPFGAPKKYLDLYNDTKLPNIKHPQKPTWPSTWHRSGEFMKYKRWGRDPNSDAEFSKLVRKHYAACVSYADAQVGKLMTQLKELKLDSKTIVVLWGDHGWHLGERGIWGKHSLFEESLHSPLIIKAPGLQAKGPSHAIVETIDIYPTLLDLAGFETPTSLHGKSLKDHMIHPVRKEGLAISYWRNLNSIRNHRFRLIRRGEGQDELYDFSQGQNGSQNMAETYPKEAEALNKQLEERLKRFPKRRF